MKFNNLDLHTTTLMATLLSLPLWISGCAIDEAQSEAQTDLQAATQGLSCKLFRPVTWIGFAATCHEAGGVPSPLILSDGATFQATAVPGGGFGIGFVTIQCNNGKLETLQDECMRDPGGV